VKARRKAVGIAVSTAALALGASSVALVAAPTAGAAPVPQDFTTPGSATFDVPAGICSVSIVSDGGHGGAGVGGASSSAPSTRTGDGQVTISYDSATDGCTTPPPAPPAPTAVPAAARFTG
jgi:hypothetical protein